MATQLTITVDGVSATTELTETQADALEFSTNVFNNGSGSATQAEFLLREVVGDTDAWARQRLQLRLDAVPIRLKEMPADKIVESEQIFQIPADYPNGKDPLPPYVPPAV